jgi:transcriptional regulator with XRE-family HTH domain
MVLLRYRRGWYEKQELARAAGFTPSQVSMWELGERPIPMEVLERTAAVTGFPPQLIDPVIRGLRSMLIAAEGRSKPMHALVDRFATELVVLLQECADQILAVSAGEAEEPVQAPSPDDREETADLWARMEGCDARMRRILVEEAREFQSWALSERVAAESLRTTDDPHRALELAELALLIAGRASREPPWRWRLEGYALAHIANARRACGDLRGAERDLAAARELWEEGARGDQGLLSKEVFSSLVSPGPG